MKESQKLLRPPGLMFDVGGHRLHALITGETNGQVPVVLEAGLTAMSSCWAWVQEDLARFTRVLSYDRAGLGWSDVTLNEKDASSIAQELRALLDAAKFPRPFILAGHSMGGIFGRAYQSLYPADVAGVALVDASHPEQMERSPNIKNALRRFFWFLQASPFLASAGIMKMWGDFGLSAQAEGLPPGSTQAARNFYSSAQHLRATVREADQWFKSCSQVRELLLADLPLVTITAPERRMAGWMDLQKELAALSTHGTHVIVEGATHLTLLTKKTFATGVSEEIKTLARRIPTTRAVPE